MQVNVLEHHGVWDTGLSLDKHTLSSTLMGYNENGHEQWDTVRTPLGEALFQLKYRNNSSYVPVLAEALYESALPRLGKVDALIPMPPSKYRARQPVIEVTRALAQLAQIPCLEDLIVKHTATPAMKDISQREDKIAALMHAYDLNEGWTDGAHSVLIIDDLFDTGASLEAATQVLRRCNHIQRICVATITRRK